jgi:uncharacterized protein YggU (UPF0235/DUF167 family)
MRAEDAPLPLVAADGGARLSVRLTPRAARAGIDGIAPDADGRPWLRVSVTAAPEAGKANTALVALLAKAWKVPKGAIQVTAGASDRRKTLHITADAATVEGITVRLAALPRR